MDKLIVINAEVNVLCVMALYIHSYQWGMSDDERTLAQYLGLNAEEEDAWVIVSEDALRELLDKQRRK